MWRHWPADYVLLEPVVFLFSKSLGCCTKVERKGELYPDSPSLFF